MALTWTAGFEGIPKGLEMGSSSSLALRQIKTLFETMMVLEHEWIETAVPVMTHKAGDCSVCGLSDGIPTPLDVEGALWWDYTNSALYRDAGGGVGVGSTVVSFDHSTLDNLDSATAHTNYILLAGDTIQDVTVPVLEGLSTTPGDFTDDKYVLSQEVHLTTPAAHDAGVITASYDFTGFAFGLDKLKYTANVTVFDGDITFANVSSNIYFGRYSLWPYLRNGTASGVAIALHPMFDALPPTDYIGGCRIERRNYGIGHVTLAVTRLDV